MGLFSLRRIGTLIEEKLEDRKRRIEQEKKDQAELAAVQKKALYEERIRMAPVIARERAIIEKNQTIAAIKAGKGQGTGKALFQTVSKGIQNFGNNMAESYRREQGFLTAPSMDFSIPQAKGGGKPFGAWDLNLQQPQKELKPRKQKKIKTKPEYVLVRRR